MFIDVTEAAKRLGYKKSYVYKLVWAHALPYYKPTGRHLLFDVDELDAYVRAGRVPTDAELQEKADALLTGKQGAK